jgi:ribosomal protein L32
MPNVGECKNCGEVKELIAGGMCQDCLNNGRE